MAKPSMLFEGVWISAAFLRRPVGGLRPHARAEQEFESFTRSKSERREVRLLPSAPSFRPEVPVTLARRAATQLRRVA